MVLGAPFRIIVVHLRAGVARTIVVDAESRAVVATSSVLVTRRSVSDARMAVFAPRPIGTETGSFVPDVPWLVAVVALRGNLPALSVTLPLPRPRRLRPAAQLALPAMPLPGSLAATLLAWQNLFILAGTAAATLIGLMFVAVTFGASLVTKETAGAARAFLDPTFMHFVEVLLIACVSTIPTLQPNVFGGLLIAVAALRLGGLYWVFLRYREAHQRNRDVELSDWVVSIILPFFCHLGLAATGAGFLRGRAEALTGLAVVIIGLLLIGIYSAWELLVWMALAVSERTRNGSAGR